MGLYGSPELYQSNNQTNNFEKNLIYCETCGFRYSKKIKRCPQCGKKHAQPVYNKWWFWFFVVIVVFSFFPSKDNDESKSIQAEQLTISEEDYKLSCISVEYVEIARNPNNYIGENVVFCGKVMQVQENANNVMLRVYVTQGNYDVWEDAIYIDYKRKTNDESRILEDDIITVYGKMNGIKQYQSVLGNQVSIPHLLAEYIEVN